MSIKLRINPERVSLARRAQGLTQDEAAKRLGVGKRTYQRLESPDNDTKLSFSELSSLAVELKQFPAMLLAELPMHFTFSGILVKSAEHFVRVFDNAYKFSIEHIPDDPEIENALIEMRDEHKSLRELWANSRQSGYRRDLDGTIKMRNLYRTTTSNNKVDRLKFFWVPFNTCGIDYAQDQFRWSFQHEIVAASAYGDEPPVRSYPASYEYSHETYDTHEGKEYHMPESHALGISNEDFARDSLLALPEISVSAGAEDDISLPNFAELDPDFKPTNDGTTDKGFAYKSAQETSASGAFVSSVAAQEEDGET